MRGQGKNSPHRRGGGATRQRKSSLTSKAAGGIVRASQRFCQRAGPAPARWPHFLKTTPGRRFGIRGLAPRSRTEIPFHAKEVRADVVPTVGSRRLVRYSLSGLVEEPAPSA